MAPPQQVHDEHWLKQQLVQALHWDDDVAEGVLGLIVNATKPEEVQEVTAAYMDNNPTAVCAISDFLAARQGGKQQQQPQQQPQQQHLQHKPQQQQQQQQQRSGAGAPAASSSYSSTVSAAPQPAAKQPPAASKQQQQDKWLHLGGQPPAAGQGTSQAEDAGAQGSGKQQAEATLAMFKRGGRLTTKSAAAGAAGAAGGGGSGGAGSSRRKGEQVDSITARLERKVANCLSCGKIFDCRNVTSDVMRFIDSGFKCTYCGSTVAMTQQQRIQQAQQQQAQQQQEEQAAVSSPPLDAADAQARAIAFKDRLVEYDRHAQQRTTVIDDQSDFFEIETNAWLSEEERVELRRRAQLEEEAAAARRNKVTVTLDLLGRKVVVADGPDVPQPGGTGAGGSSFELGGTSATQQLLQQVQAAVSKERRGEQDSGKQGSSSTSAPGSKGAEETLAEALAAISNLRISAHPNLTTTPIFVPKRKQQQQQEPAAAGKGGQQDGKQIKHGKQQKGKQTQKPQPGAQKAGQQAAKQPRKQLSAVAARAAAADSRVQDDSIFGDFEAELLCDELLRKQPAQATQAVQ